MPNSCSICGWPMHEEQSRFYFQKLPAWHALSKYHGTVHIDCLRALPNKEDVSKSLADFCESFYGKDSPTPIVARERNFVVKNCVKDGACFEIYDFWRLRGIFYTGPCDKRCDSWSLAISCHWVRKRFRYCIVLLMGNWVLKESSPILLWICMRLRMRCL